MPKAPFVNVIGFVADFRPPFKTKGPDWKCSFEIKDYSNKDSSYGLKMDIFWPEHLMPQFSNLPGDAVLIRQARVSFFPSLHMQHAVTFFRVASKICRKGIFDSK